MANLVIDEKLTDLLTKAINPIEITKTSGFDKIIDSIGEARIVLMGEATHGTEEFYQTRIALSQLLIEQKGFKAIAIEGDWPSVYSMHRYILGSNEFRNERTALDGFTRFPTWMWANTSMPPFLHWLRQYNDNLDVKAKVGIYGLDLYSLHDSMQAIIAFLASHQPDLAEQAKNRYACFDHTAMDPQMYGYFVNQHLKHSCIKEVKDQLLEMQHRTFSTLNADKLLLSEAEFYANQNARLVKNAEEYYRAMFEPRAISWNLRDSHMAQTLSNVIAHIESKSNLPAKVIVWAHNSHVGDARATEMNDRGEVNLGQLVREHYDTSSYLLGFSTYTGTVMASSDWDYPAEIKTVLPALEASYEALFHKLSTSTFFLNLRNKSHLIELLKHARLQRAIGVIYLPESERLSHYYFSRLPYQFDSIIHIDKTSALTALSKENQLRPDDLPETYPTGE
ncbi:MULTISPECIES: erythromycin esterase family protein [unclassified Legionella]|uniref:erythromycin esterase family protein n=1 Tax=unclassified Legionella TaxID=2622702 RepID=UPI001E3A1958|nr:erythromycin esterase family protein [Legionella sp. 31fI33]MCC5015126.1 erythromycin esterase family protein [Legionella sp. 31fI33]